MPNPPPPPPSQPCPSWPQIEAQLMTGGMPAYRCALQIVYAWCSQLTAQIADLQAGTPDPWTLPASIPAAGVIHAPAAGTEES